MPAPDAVQNAEPICYEKVTGVTSVFYTEFSTAMLKSVQRSKNQKEGRHMDGLKNLLQTAK
ncbi:MAG: hypothetical protein DMG80_04920 [Acidobacteria bacterium]|nr:MAG: hypothetical protein DMG80_04920 [Acidobacteriota bacterium]